MKWDIFCYHTCGEEYEDAGSSYMTSQINTTTLMSFTLDDTKRYNGYDRHFCTSVRKVAPTYRMHSGIYLSMRQIIPVQFYPRPISLYRYFGLEYYEPMPISKPMLELLTCKQEHTNAPAS